VAFKEDALIFNALLHPLIIEKSSPVSKKQWVDEDYNSSDESDESDSELSKVKATNLLCT